jgi:hypothetical protein
VTFAFAFNACLTILEYLRLSCMMSHVARLIQLGLGFLASLGMQVS